MTSKLRYKALVLALLAMTSLPRPLHGAELDGKFTSLFESRQNRDGTREAVLDNYLRLDLDKLFVTPLSLHAYGKYGTELNNGPDSTDIYHLYAQYRTFQGETDLKLGRFPLESHRFLTLDGAYLTMRPEGRIGAAIYAGQPRYLEFYPEQIQNRFRDTGDYLAGGKLFLQGVEGARANVYYSREGKDGTVYREIVGAGGGKDFRFNLLSSEVKMSADGSLDYNTDQAAIDKLTARLFFAFDKKLRLLMQADRYDIRDDYPADRQLIISLLSTGREDRIFYTLTYDLSTNFSVYQGSVFTGLRMPDGVWQNGTIVRGGVTVNFIKPAGLDLDAGVYRFESFLAKASGVSATLKWRPLRLWTTQAGVEAVLYDAPFRSNKTAKTVSAEVGYSPVSRLKLAFFAEQSDNPEFKSDFRTGLRLDYNFGFATGSPGLSGPRKEVRQ
jgi:hypothetical protein